jgi:hypothetical protein
VLSYLSDDLDLHQTHIGTPPPLHPAGVPERKAVSEHLIDERGNMLQQEVMIEKLRALCERDERVVAALMYGSFALTQGDRFSDIEFYLFFEEKALDGLEEGWLSQIAPLELYYINEFGNDTAIFENLVRDELHLEPYSKVVMVGAWETAWFPSLESAVLVDKTGELSRRVSRLVQRPPEVDTPERALLLCRSLMNWTLMGNNLLKRGSTPAPRRFDASPRPPPPGRAAGGGEERQLVEPVPTAGGGRLCGLLRKVQGVHSSLERGAVGSGVHVDVGVEPEADVRTGYEPCPRASRSPAQQARPAHRSGQGTEAELPGTSGGADEASEDERGGRSAAMSGKRKHPPPVYGTGDHSPPRLSVQHHTTRTDLTPWRGGC